MKMHLAYVDPGSASYVVQIIAASLLAGVASLRLFRRRIASFFRSIFTRSKEK
jgi:hypothetical protein